MNEVKEFLEFVYGDRIHYKLKEFGLPGIGSAIASGQEILIANIEFPKVHFDHLQSAVELAGRVGFHVIYESIYQDRVELHQS